MDDLIVTILSLLFIGGLIGFWIGLLYKKADDDRNLGKKKTR